MSSFVCRHAFYLITTRLCHQLSACHATPASTNPLSRPSSQHEQTHHELELRRLDATRHVVTSGGDRPAEDGEASSAGAAEDEEEEVDEDEYMKRHALRQAELNNELLVREAGGRRAEWAELNGQGGAKYRGASS